MADNNLTILQKLTHLLRRGGTTITQSKQQEPEHVYNMNTKELLRTQDRLEYEQKKLSLQQSKYLTDKWLKIDNELHNQQMLVETTRLATYFDVESMEFTPELAIALDTFSEEATQPSEKGEILTIYSESKRVKTILKNLFENVLDVNINLQMWTRNMIKYGDNFVYLKLDEEKGIIGCYQLPNIEIERLEGDAYKNGAGVQTNNTIKPEDIDREKEKLTARKVRFRWKDKGMDFQPWEVAHFRLLGDDRKLPYGSSILEKCRRIWKNLVLAEDAMLQYRLERAPERRVFKVFVGNMDDNDVEAYIHKVANKFKRDQVVDPRNGQVDTRYNVMGNTQDYFIPVRDQNASMPIETLPGANNLAEIADIEYIQKKMLAAIRIPKAFLGFEEVVGDGKGLSVMDIRFARVVNKIQKALIQELNKIAIIHLYLMGLEDELDNFTLGLTNPSTQSELLKIEQWKEKILLYKDAVGDGQSIAPVSHTFAKKFFLGMSDEEVKLDLQQQKVERGINEDLNNSKNIKVPIFNNINTLYSSGEAQPAEGDENDDNGLGGLGGGGGSFSSSDIGGDVPPPEEGDAGEGAMAPPPDGGEEGAVPSPEEESNEMPPPLSESLFNSLLDKKKSISVDLQKGKRTLKEINDELDSLLNE